MFKIFLLSKAEYLTEYDVGAYYPEMEKLDLEEHKIKEKGYFHSWASKQARDQSNISYRDYMAKLDNIKHKHEAVIVAAKQTIALFNSREKAVEAIKFFRYYDDKYQKCEFEVVRAKK